MEDPSATCKLPNRRDKQHILSRNPKRITEEGYDDIMAAICTRARLNYEEDGLLGYAQEQAEMDAEDSDGEDSLEPEEVSSDEESSDDEGMDSDYE